MYEKYQYVRKEIFVKSMGFQGKNDLYKKYRYVVETKDINQLKRPSLFKKEQVFKKNGKNRDGNKIMRLNVIEKSNCILV